MIHEDSSNKSLKRTGCKSPVFCTRCAHYCKNSQLTTRRLPRRYIGLAFCQVAESYFGFERVKLVPVEIFLSVRIVKFG